MPAKSGCSESVTPGWAQDPLRFPAAIPENFTVATFDERPRSQHLGWLTPSEVLVLEALFLEKQDGKTRVTHSLENSEDALNWRMEICARPQEDALRKLQLPEGDYRVMSDNPARLGLVQQTVWGVTRSGLRARRSTGA